MRFLCFCPARVSCPASPVDAIHALRAAADRARAEREIALAAMRSLAADFMQEDDLILARALGARHRFSKCALQ